MASVASTGSGSGGESEPAEASSPEIHVPESRNKSTCAPPLEQRCYTTWSAFLKALEQYQEQTHQVFRKRTSTSAASRNAELAKRGKLTETTRIPDSFDKYYRRLCCTHGWSRVSRSTGKRSNYFVKSTGCEAQISVTVVWTGDHGFQVKITQ
ncbi:hypothetical protein F441_21948 [Phytophthora nicotianae CJ01A1]|uniref:Uncharacterized protein n=4 Tax=Phytophthora nicotianae TaxID=4792 RepID=V9DW45_PHYNI|nr:hypothetical protein F443_22053 [Phytophthora nicotianae P1569]ETK71273.1 hypothetical protein L915_21461 [Phytophthora nicotianae]ETO59586.1 hypothetical protein F444_22072 [Phytophthora nicotianae P1976]ETP00693.1 hypothetical protein F441_21948 [Phytophthora nicotianae CJ01A1]ETL24701.1 hypothetical protein L916_21325 [Phytophthora nicotianae]